MSDVVKKVVRYIVGSPDSGPCIWSADSTIVTADSVTATADGAC